MSLRRRYFRTRPSRSVLAMLVVGLGCLIAGLVIAGTPVHYERVGNLHHVPVKSEHFVDYLKVALDVIGGVLLLAAAVRHANQLETIDDLVADGSSPVGGLTDPRATPNTNAQQSASRLG
jgi:hypothetical protein